MSSVYNPCPFCKTSPGYLHPHRWGCTNEQCPEKPTIYCPIKEGSPFNTPEAVDEKIQKFWERIIKTSEEVKKSKQKQLKKLQAQVNTYYS